MYNWWSQNTECNLKYIPIIMIENSNQLMQQLKHMRTKFYILYVIPEYRVPWLDIYKYPLPDTCTRYFRYFNQVAYCRGINSLLLV